MPGVRALTQDDIPRLVDLHGKGFGGDRPRDQVERFLSDLMFDHPWVDEGMPPLGYEDGRGRLIGCLGVMPRPMILDDEPIRAVVSNNFIVDPDGQPGIASFALMRALRGAGADLVMGEASEAARKICERLGWATIEPRSRRWLRPLRPAALGVGLMERRFLPRALARGMEAVCSIPDALACRTPGSPLRVTTPRREDAPLDADTLFQLIGRASRGHTLRPCYDRRSLAWLLDVLGRTRRAQTLRGGLVRGEGDEPAGWYLYYSRPGGMARVLQLGAEHGQRARVLRHLFHDALREDNTAVTGVSDPEWDDALSAASCLFREGSSWLIAHARDPRTRHALSSQDAFLSRLETEAWITFAF